MIENLQETTKDTIDVDGGWLVTHHTRTWDVRIRLDEVTSELDAKKLVLADAQKAVDDEQARVDAIEAAKAQ
mgnify:CR=1 FL=1